MDNNVNFSEFNYIIPIKKLNNLKEKCPIIKATIINIYNNLKMLNITTLSGRYVCTVRMQKDEGVKIVNTGELKRRKDKIDEHLAKEIYLKF